MVDYGTVTAPMALLVVEAPILLPPLLTVMYLVTQKPNTARKVTWYQHALWALWSGSGSVLYYT